MTGHAEWAAFLDYDLPPELIAQHPCATREDSRLMVLDRLREAIEDRRFRDLPALLRPGDCVVVNDSRVVPARLMARKESGGSVDLLVVPGPDDRLAEALYRSSKPLRVGQVLHVEGAGRLRVAATPSGGRCVVEAVDFGLRATFASAGRLPLPPYIGRDEEAADRDRYQTVYARVEGSVAAPTAGLHFSPSVIETLRAKQIDFVAITLHVGPGTFVPIRDAPEAHRMEAEWCSVSPEAAAAIERTRRGGGRIVAVGTTTVRALETVADEQGRVRPWKGSTSLFIRPGYRFRAVDALVTNFHLPRTTLLCLVMAFAGCERTRRAYERAIERRYRFYSYGDAMLIL